MLGDCSNSWQYGCEWTIGYLWHSAFLFERLVLIVLALMLARTALIFLRVSYRSLRRAGSTDITNPARRELAVELSRKLRSLRSIFSAAPYLGLMGTCLGIVDAFASAGRSQGLAYTSVVEGISVAFLSTAAGILVTVPATCLHNYLRTRIDSFEIELPDRRLNKTRFPLSPRLSTSPFQLTAVPILVLSIAAFVIFPTFNVPKGLHVRLMPLGALEAKAPSTKPFVVAVVSGGAMAMPTVYINAKRTTWQDLENKLQSELSGRPNSIVYVQADEDIPYLLVIYAIDVAKQLHAEVFLITAAPDIDHPRKQP